MAFNATMLRSATGKSQYALSPLRRWIHAAPQPAPLQAAIDNLPSGPPFPPYVLPEDETHDQFRAHYRNSPFLGGNMELMAVPKKKTTPHKKGIRNGPKALKPVPVIIRCRACGRVKLPHFFCCSGIKQNPGDQNS